MYHIEPESQRNEGLSENTDGGRYHYFCNGVRLEEESRRAEDESYYTHVKHHTPTIKVKTGDFPTGSGDTCTDRYKARN